jgi:hypothetical protein
MIMKSCHNKHDKLPHPQQQLWSTDDRIQALIVKGLEGKDGCAAVLEPGSITAINSRVSRMKHDYA